MNKFCKIFNTKVSQVLITKCEDETNKPCVRFVFMNKNKNMIEQVFDFESEELRDAAYDTADKETAEGLVTHPDFADM